MKTETQTYKAKLLSKDSKIRQAAINQLAKSGDIKQLEFLMHVLFEKRVGNDLSYAINSIGNFQNECGKKSLIEIYGSVNDNEKKLIIKSLLKLGVFKNFFSGNHLNKSIQEQLWALLFGLNSDQLKNIISLGQQEFKDKLDFAWRTTKHWRNKNAG
jgi:hypothetical protein